MTEFEDWNTICDRFYGQRYVAGFQDEVSIRGGFYGLRYLCQILWTKLVFEAVWTKKIFVPDYMSTVVKWHLFRCN